MAIVPIVALRGPAPGVWRHAEGGIEVTAFEPFSDHVWEDLENEAAGLLALLDGRDDAVYRRFGHWWMRLEGAQVRVLGRA